MAVITKNMGHNDRIIRGLLGSLMFIDGLFSNRKLETGIGGAFAIYGLTGFDPLLKVFGASTIPGAKDNILHQLKQTAPGKGINPMLTQQALPQKETLSVNKEISFADSIAIK